MPIKPKTFITNCPLTKKKTKTNPGLDKQENNKPGPDL